MKFKKLMKKFIESIFHSADVESAAPLFRTFYHPAVDKNAAAFVRITTWRSAIWNDVCICTSFIYLVSGSGWKAAHIFPTSARWKKKTEERGRKILLWKLIVMCVTRCQEAVPWIRMCDNQLEFFFFLAAKNLFISFLDLDATFRVSRCCDLQSQRNTKFSTPVGPVVDHKWTQRPVGRHWRFC